MAEPTISHQSDAVIWGQLIDGTGRYISSVGGLVRCDLCGRLRLNFAGPHGERVLPNGQRLNCLGVDVTVAAALAAIGRAEVRHG